MQSAITTGKTSAQVARRPGGDLLRCACLVGGLLALGACSVPLHDWMRPAAERKAEAQMGAGWEGRRLLAQMLFLQTHAVIHAGVEEREARAGEAQSRANEFHKPGGGEQTPAATPAEKGEAHAPPHKHNDGKLCTLDHKNIAHAEGEGHEEHAGEEHHDEHPADAHHEEGHAEGDGHDHEGGHVFVIPPAREDFRGVLGNLERAIKPYTDSQGRLYSKADNQTIPFFRLMTWADPHFIDGYVVGVHFICEAGKHSDEALKYLHEGEQNNPDSFEIQEELGHVNLVYRKDYAAAERHLLRAVQLLPHRKLTETEEESRTDTYRWLALNYSQWGKPEQAMRVARAGLKVVGPDVTLERVLEKKGLK